MERGLGGDRQGWVGGNGGTGAMRLLLRPGLGEDRRGCWTSPQCPGAGRGNRCGVSWRRLEAPHCWMWWHLAQEQAGIDLRGEFRSGFGQGGNLKRAGIGLVAFPQVDDVGRAVGKRRQGVLCPPGWRNFWKGCGRFFWPQFSVGKGLSLRGLGT